MAEITWRNVNSDMSAYQGRALEGAGRSLDSMFDKLTGAIARSQAVDDKNFETTKVNRTNDGLNKIMSYTTPEEYATAQKSGALQALLNSGQVDQQALRTAMDSRLPMLQQRATQGIQYKNTLVDDKTAPLMEAARMAAIGGRSDEAQALLGQYAAAGGRFGSQGAEFADGRVQLGVTRKRDDTRFTWEGEDQRDQHAKASDDLLTNRVQRDMYRNNMANDDANRKLKEKELEWKQRGEGNGPGSRAAIEAQYKAFKDNSVMSQGSYGTKEGKTELLKGLKERGVTPDQTEDVLTELAKRYSKGIAVGHDEKGIPKDFLPVPVAMILEELDKSADNPLAYITPAWSRRGDVLVKNIDKRFGIQESGYLMDPKNRDNDAINEMRAINSFDHERTKGLFRDGQDLEIRTPTKGKGNKGSGGGGGFPTNPKVGDSTTLPDKSTYKYTSAGWVRQYQGE